MNPNGHITTPKVWEETVLDILQLQYGLSKNDVELPPARSQDETPREFVKRYAEKHDLRPLLFTMNAFLP